MKIEPRFKKKKHNYEKEVNMEKFVVNIKCPYCRKSLMDADNPIDGYPSVRTEIQIRDKKGPLFLSSIFGSYSISSEIFIPKDDLVLFFCPECSAAMMMKHMCEECHAPLALFELMNGGTVQICSRRGCKYHYLDYSNFAQKISDFYFTHQAKADPFRKK